MATFGLVVGSIFATADLAPAVRDRLAREPRARRARAALGADELRAADRALPRRGALGLVRRRHARERDHHRRRDDPARRRLAQGRDRRARRQLHRHAGRLLRPARLPPLPARARVRPRPLPPDAALRPAARAVRPRALGDRPLRPLLPRAHEGARRDRPLLGRRPDLDRAPARADRAADRLAGLRLLDQGRRRGQAHLRLRAHLRALPLLLALAGALAARAVARAPADDAAVLPGRRRSCRCSSSAGRPSSPST